ncbi:response regulator [Thermodesulfobacteriota bacterium]
MIFSIVTKSPYLSRKLLVSILLVSSAITLFLTGIQLYLNFNHEVSLIEEQLQQVEKGFLDSIAESVWDMDMRRLEIQLQGLTKLPAMHQCEVFNSNGQIIASVGDSPGRNSIVQRLELTVYRNTRQETLGHLEITASLEQAYSHLKQQLAVILISQGLKTFLVSGFILFIVNYLVMRHLSAMARYAKELDMNNLEKPLVLDTPPDAAHDELYHVAQAINTMRENFLADISQREKVEEELANIHDYLQDIFNSIPSSMIAIAPDCTVVRWNTEAEKITGLDAGAVEGRKLTEVIPFIEGAIDRIEQTMQSHEINTDIQLTSQREGKDFHWDITVFPLVRKDLSGAVIRIDDITEKYQLAMEKSQLEDKLLQAQKMEAIGTLAGGIAHDFNNILTAIIGYGEMVLLGLESGSRAHADQCQVLQAGDRARELVRQILAFSRQVEEERIPVQTYYIVKEALKLLRPAIPTTIAIKQNLDLECGTILADPAQIHQIIMNLCTNAYQAMRKGGGELGVTLTSVTIAADDIVGTELVPGSYVRLEISDTGGGIDQATLARIFDPYFTTKKKGEGTGLGLAVVHGIVKSHNGHIIVDSNIGEGTTFQVYLPEIEEEIAPQVQVESDQDYSGTERILVVDDQPEIVRLFENILMKHGYQVTGFSNSAEAYETLKGDPQAFDLIITDMTMPDMTGVELASKVLLVRPDLPIILCTGFSELVNREQATALGIREFVMKPIKTQELGKMIRKVLDENHVLEADMD